LAAFWPCRRDIFFLVLDVLVDKIVVLKKFL
jgi:hypothetical protein